MNTDFPISDVSIKYTKNIVKLSAPHVTYPGFQVNENEFLLEVDNVARYLVRNGNEIFIQPHKLADPASIHLFLTGSVFGALLHQKNLLALHGSSFSYNGNGVIICGTSGVGKSSVVAAFCQEGGVFINDDITPLKISDNQITILPIKTRLKLWDDTLEKLKIRNDNFDRIRPTIEKYYMPSNGLFNKEQNLDHLIILDTHNKNEFLVRKLTGLEKYHAIRNQIYRIAYLNGMKKTELIYFNQLVKLSKQTPVNIVIRPQKCGITDTMEFIKREIVG